MWFPPLQSVPSLGPGGNSYLYSTKITAVGLGQTLSAQTQVTLEQVTLERSWNLDA